MTEPAAQLLRALATAAVVPGLRSVLCFDVEPSPLLRIAATFSRMLQAADGVEVRRVILGSTQGDDALWSQLSWRRDGTGVRPVLLPGPLAPAPAGTLTLVVIVDLAQLDVVAARAAVTLVGADVAHLERHGETAVWRPTTAWIAACETPAVGGVSPHLLDRFALRLRPPVPDRATRTDDLLAAVERGEPAPDAQPAVSPSLISAVTDARHRDSALSGEASDAVLRITASASMAGTRRDLALARLATALARLDDAEEVTPEHVDDAAELVGVAPASSHAGGETDAGAQPAAEPPQGIPGHGYAEPSEPASGYPRAPEVGPVFAGAMEQTLPAVEFEETVPASVRGTDLYPEDEAPVDRELEPLRLPAPRRDASGVPSGVPIGVQPASGLHDLAFASTIIEALKYQPARRRANPDRQRDGLLVSPSDLRSHRRAPPVRELLTLVLDYTSQGERPWSDALIPYLRWAYAQRAAICLVRVGAADAESALRAERTLARSLLDPRLSRQLESAAGQATPLAHGLELARQALRHALHHGRAGVGSAWLVVATDGRGNVPLEASLSERGTAAVGRAGLDDALAVAEQIAGLDRVRRTLIDPEPAVLRELPTTLALALDARLVTRCAAVEVTADAL